MKTTYTHEELIKNYGEAPVEDALKLLKISNLEKYDTSRKEVIVLLQQLSGHKSSGEQKSFSDWSKSQQPISQKPENIPQQEETHPSSQQIFPPDLTAAVLELGTLESLMDPEALKDLNNLAYAQACSEAIALVVLKARHAGAAQKNPAVVMVREMLQGASYAPHGGMEEAVLEIKKDLEKRLPPSQSFLQNILPPRSISQPGEENGTEKRLAGSK